MGMEKKEYNVQCIIQYSMLFGLPKYARFRQILFLCFLHEVPDKNAFL